MADETPIRMTRAEYEAKYGQPAPTRTGAAGVYDALVGEQANTTPGRVFAGGMQNIFNALTFGLGDEFVAGANTAIDYLPFMENVGYDQHLQNVRDMRGEFRGQAGPALSIAQDIGTGFLNPIGQVKNGASLISSVGKNAASGGLQGALYGFGEAEGGLGERAVSAGVGGATGSAMGGLLTAALQGGSDILQHFTQSGQQSKAGEILRDVAGPDGIERVMSYVDDSYFGPRTFSEVAQSPNAAAFEQSMRKEMGDGNELLAALKQRHAKRVDALKGVVPDAPGTVTPDIRGANIRDAAAIVSEASDKAQQARWENLKGRRISFDPSPAFDPIVQARETIGPKGVSSTTQRILNAVIRSDDNGNLIAKPMSIDDYLKIRSDAGEEFVRQAQNGNNKEARLLATVRDSLDEALGAAPMTSSVNKKHISTIQRALDATKKHKQIHESGAPGAITARGAGEGGFRLEESKIPGRILRSPEAAKQFARAYGKNPDAMAQARGALIDDITKGNPDTWAKAFNQKRPQAKAILGDHFGLVAAVIKNLDSELSVGRLAQEATGRGSITAQGISAQKFLEGKTTQIKKLANAAVGTFFGNILSLSTDGGFSGALVGSGLGAAAGQAAGQAADRAIKQIRSMVVRGLRDPEYAKVLLASQSGAWPRAAARNLAYAAGQQSGIQAGQSFAARDQ